MKVTTLAAIGMLAVLPIGHFTAVKAAENEAVKAVDPTDLWGLWREGFEKYEQAETASKTASRQDEAIRLYGEAKSLFESIRKQNPSWNKEVIAYRITLCERRVREINQPRIDALERAKKQKIESEKALSNEVARLRADLRKARLEIIELKNNADKGARYAEQVKTLMSEKTTLENRLAAFQVQLETLQNKLAKADKTSEFNKKILAERARAIELEKLIRHLQDQIADLNLQKKKMAAVQDEKELALKKAEKRVKELNSVVETIGKLRKENEQLNTKIDTASAENKRLRNSLSSTMDKNSDLQDQIARLRSGKEVTPTVRKLEDDLNLAKKEGEFLRVQVENLKKQLKKNETELQTGNADRRQLALELARAVSEQTRIKNENTSLVIRISELELKHKKLTGNSASVTLERDNLKKEIQALASKHEELRKAAEKSASRLVELNQLQKRCNELEAKLKVQPEVVTKTVTVVQKDPVDAAAAKALKEQNEKLQTELNALKNTKPQVVTKTVTVVQKDPADAAAAKALKEQNEKLQTELNALKNTKQQVVTKTITVVQKDPVDSAAIKTLKEQNAKLTADLDNALKNKPSVITKTVIQKDPVDAAAIATLKEQNTKLLSELNTLKNTSPQVVTKTVTVVQKDPADAAAAKALKEQNEKLLAELNALKNTKPQVVTKTVTVVQKDPADEKVLKTVRTEKEQLQTELDSVKQQNEKIRKELLKRNEESKTLTQTITLIRRELQASRTAEAAAEKKAAEIQAKYASAPAKTDTAVQEKIIAEQKEKIAAGEKRINELILLSNQTVLKNKAKIKQLEDQQIAQREQIEKLRANTEKTTQEEIKKLSATVTELVEGKTQYENALRSMTNHRNALNTRNKILAEELAQAKQDIIILKDKLSNSSSKVESDRRNNELLDKLNKLENENSKLMEEQKALQKTVSGLKGKLQSSEKELANAWKDAGRYRAELKRWTEDPTKVAETIIKRKDEAIDALVREGVELRKELAMIKSELLMANDKVNKYETMSLAITRKHQRLQAEMNRLKRQISDNPAKPAEKKAKTSVTVIPVQTKEKTEQIQVLKVDKTKYQEAMTEAKAAEKKDDAAGALMNYWRAVDADPNSTEAHLGLVRVYLKRGDKTGAAKAYAKAIELGAPKDANIEAQLKAK